MPEQALAQLNCYYKIPVCCSVARDRAAPVCHLRWKADCPEVPLPESSTAKSRLSCSLPAGILNCEKQIVLQSPCLHRLPWIHVPAL